MENTAVPNGRPTRRRLVEAFLGGGLFASLVSFVYPVVRYLVPPSVADLGGNEVIAAKIGDLKPNSAKLFRFGSRPGLLLRVGEGEYRAFSATCTHLSCTVQYRMIFTRFGAHAITACTTSMGATSRGLLRAHWRTTRFTFEAKTLWSAGSGRPELAGHVASGWMCALTGPR